MPGVVVAAVAAPWRGCQAGQVLREFPLPGSASDRLGADGSPRQPAPAVRGAATVMLVRNATPGVEVFAFRRVPRLAFAPGMLVFPGGSVDPGDAGTPFLDEPTGDAVAVAAAVRETFEECGALLAVDATGAAPDAATLASPAWEERRLRLAAGELALADVLADAGLAVRAADLCPWARWVTPPFERRRFDTRFYVAALPPGQQARDLGGEGERATWLSPAAAVAAHARGELPMLPPTLVCLEELAAAPDVATLLATPRTPRPVSPWVARDGAGALVLRIDLDGRGGGEPGE
jgi:8-oxo-dGTP pyrophosphatase MutT (NUDIX family)